MDYEMKYKEVKELIEDCIPDEDGYIHVRPSDIFPELKESEDERIRKALKEYFINSFQNNGVAAICGVHIKDILIWLERQGEHKKFRDSIQVGDKVTKNEDGVLVNLSQLNRLAKKYERQGEQKPIEKPTKGNYYTCIKDYQFCEHDDVTFEMGKIYKCEEDGKITADNGGLWPFSNITGFFRLSTHEEISSHLQKPEWSEEDTEMIDCLIRHCKKEYEELCNDKYGHQEIVSDLKRSCRERWDWLESLKNKNVPQSHWKPSEEQMEVLLSEVTAWTKGCPKQIVLESLYQDLKKLKE